MLPILAPIKTIALVEERNETKGESGNMEAKNALKFRSLK
jgi:hypothetical protein